MALLLPKDCQVVKIDDGFFEQFQILRDVPNHYFHCGTVYSVLVLPLVFLIDVLDEEPLYGAQQAEDVRQMFGEHVGEPDEDLQLVSRASGH